MSVKSSSYYPTSELFGYSVFSGTTNEFLEILFNGNGKTVGYLNAHTLNLALDDPGTEEVFKQLDLIYADGMSIVKTSHKARRPLAERINAGDFFPRFLWKCAAKGKTVALIGSEEGVAEMAASHLQHGLPVSPARLTHHGFIERDSEEEAHLIDLISSQKPDFILIGMGTPRQEEFALRLKVQFPRTTIWCVGALFEYYGHRYRAPVWIRQAGLEWCVRLALEPRRLAARYLIGNISYLQKERRWLKTLEQ